MSRYKPYIVIVISTLIFLISGCYNHKVDTLPEWCEQIAGVDLEKQYSPFWAVIFSTQFDMEAIRDDFVKILNDSYMEKVKSRADRMVWRETEHLHMTNLSSLFEIEADEMINEIKQGIEDACEFRIEDEMRKCMYDSMVSLFDRVTIHSFESDVFGKNWKDTPTVLETKIGEYKRILDKDSK